MKYKVLFVRSGELYLVRAEDGRYGLANLAQGTGEWSDDPHHFLRFTTMDEATEQPGPELMEQIGAVLEGRITQVVPDGSEEPDLDTLVAQLLQESRPEEPR